MGKISDMLAAGQTYSFEFFPPKTDEAARELEKTVGELQHLHPSFVSVTYGAGGSTRDHTIEIVEQIASDTTLLPVAHLTATGTTATNWQATVRRTPQARTATVGRTPRVRTATAEPPRVRTATAVSAPAARVATAETPGVRVAGATRDGSALPLVSYLLEGTLRNDSIGLTPTDPTGVPLASPSPTTATVDVSLQSDSYYYGLYSSLLLLTDPYSKPWWN